MSGNLFVVCRAFRCTGQDSPRQADAARATSPHLRLSISYTTRKPREGEAHGREYHFVAREVFEGMIASGDFLEHANVYGNYYGTSKRWIEEQLAAGEDVLLEIDWQGARQVRGLFPGMAGLFILPPVGGRAPQAAWKQARQGHSRRRSRPAWRALAMRSRMFLNLNI